MKLSDKIADSLKKNQIVHVQAHGQSMIPLIKSGQTLELKKVKPEDIAIGDIIVFKKADSVVCHLVVGQQTDARTQSLFFITSGSHTKHEDIPVLANEVLAKVMNIKVSKLKLLLWIIRKKINF